MKCYQPKQGYTWNPLSNIGRNDLCPCQSGRKFKKCCSNKIANCIPDPIAEEMKDKPEHIQYEIYKEWARRQK
jgi:hypothetical protein